MYSEAMADAAVAGVYLAHAVVVFMVWFIRARRDQRT